LVKQYYNKQLSLKAVTFLNRSKTLKIIKFIFKHYSVEYTASLRTVTKLVTI